MATASVGAFDSAAPSFVRLSVRMMGADGEKRSVSLEIDAAATDIQINAYVDAIQAATNATVYEVSKQLVESANPVESNADAETFQSVYANVVLLAKDPVARKSQNAFLPAPDGIMVLDGDVVDTADPLYTAWRDAAMAVLPAAYDPVTVRYTERRDKNDAVPATT